METQNIMQALQAGNIIKNTTKWKNVQNLSNAIIVLISSIISLLKFFGYNILLSDKDTIILAGIVAGILFGLNIIITTITSKKVGIIEKDEKVE